MRPFVRRAAVVALAVVSVACSDSRVTVPSTPAPSTPYTASGFPAILRPGRVYNFAQSLEHPVRDYTRQSRFVLYDDGTFALQFSAASTATTGEYLGTYRVSDGDVVFAWEDSGLVAPWAATGSLTDDSLTLRYNWNMLMSDFEDGVYRLSR